MLGYPGIGVADALDEVAEYQWRKPGSGELTRLYRGPQPGTLIAFSGAVE